MQSTIFGCRGPRLVPDEERFFADADPWGFILFSRNLQNADQTRALCSELRAAVGREAPILVDHEGGRVSRLCPHLAPQRPPMAVLGQIARAAGPDKAREAAALLGQRLGRDCRALGITVNCVPMLDVLQEGAHDIVGDRALSADPAVVADLGKALSSGLLAGGCLPVIKHLPGHGRAKVDSHEALPRTDVPIEALAAVDFVPFQALSDAPLGMTAHMIYSAVDPDLPATLSEGVIYEVIRGRIGFDGLLMTDDLSMKALTGTYEERARKSLDAGCDLVLHCNGEMDEMVAVAKGAAPLTEAAEIRSRNALAALRAPVSDDMAAAEQQLADLLSLGEGTA